MSKQSDVVISSHEGPEVATAAEVISGNASESASEVLASDENLADESETSETEGEEQEETVEASSDEDGAEKSDDQPKKKNKIQKRINKLNAKVTERDLQISERDKRIGALEAELAKAKTPTEVKEATKNLNDASLVGKPNAETFEGTHAEFIEAMADWKAEQKFVEREQKAKLEELKAQQQKQAQSFADKVTEFKDAHSDWDDVMEEVEHVPLSNFFKEQIASSDLGPELAYQLAKHPTDYERLAKLQPAQLLRELGKFEARFAKESSSAETEPKTVINKTKAPAPVTPVKAKGTSVAKSPDDMDYDEFKKWRQEQMRNG